MSDFQVIDCEQGTPEWFAARAGIPTASEFSTVQAGGKGITRRNYMLKLIGERMGGKPCEGYKNANMERGNAMEDEARAAYGFAFDVDLQRVGFMRRGRAGASLDRLIGDDGAIEIKTAEPQIHFETMLADRLPPEHVAQVQGQLLVSGRRWIDFVSYWPGLPLFVKRVFPDLSYHAQLTIALADFNSEMDALQAEIQNLRSAA